MNHARAIYAIARADFFERVRSYSFLMTLLFAVYLGYAAATGRIALLPDNRYRGVYTPAWIGTVVALVVTMFVSLVGFYIIKNAIERDRATGVGQILATTPLSKTAYLLGKFGSNFAVLGTMVGVLALGAVVMQFLVGETPQMDFWALLAPFLLFALPMMALTAAVAVLFETLPLLRGGVGNVVWFFGWGGGVIALRQITGVRWLDPAGFFTVMESLIPDAQAAIPGYQNGVTFQIQNRHIAVAQNLRWQGVTWSGDFLAQRHGWVAAAIFLVLLAALVFDRFDPSRAWLAFGKKRKSRSLGIPGAAGTPAHPAPRAPAIVHLPPLTRGVHSSGIARLFAAELRLALKGYGWWWYAVAAGLVIAQMATPLEISRGLLLTAAWLWPILVWSALGTREARYGLQQLVFSCARMVPRQLPAASLAGVAVAALSRAGVAICLLFAGPSAGLLAWIAGALFVPSLALILGVWSGTSKLFEGLYTALWYVGPLNRTPGLDFTGAASGPRTVPFALVYLALTAALLTAAFFGRRLQLQKS